jgi:hypothetical protein
MKLNVRSHSLFRERRGTTLTVGIENTRTKDGAGCVAEPFFSLDILGGALISEGRGRKTSARIWKIGSQYLLDVMRLYSKDLVPRLETMENIGTEEGIVPPPPP